MVVLTVAALLVPSVRAVQENVPPRRNTGTVQPRHGPWIVGPIAFAETLHLTGGVHVAHMIPSTISTHSPGESDVFRAIVQDPGTASWHCLHSLDLAQHPRQIMGEVDFVVIIPSLGVLCMEVKGSRSVLIRDGQWYYGNDPKPHGSPFKQASAGMHSVQEHLLKARPDYRDIPFVSAVCFPFVAAPEKSPEWHDWQAIDVGNLNARPISRILEGVLINFREHLDRTPTAKWFDARSPRPTGEECKEIALILRPEFEAYQSPKVRRKGLNDELKRYTDEQFELLDAVQDNPRVLVDGLAGTGKTMLAIELARRSASAQHETLVVCFNRPLAQYLQDQLRPLQDRVLVDTFHHYMLTLSGLSAPVGACPEFWQRQLPNAALERVVDEPGRFDELLVDEAPDLFSRPYLDVLQYSLDGELAGGRWRMFGDFANQKIYSTPGDIDADAFRRTYAPDYQATALRRNCRNPPSIADIIKQLPLPGPKYGRTLRPDNGFAPAFYQYKNPVQGAEILVRSLDVLYGEGYRGDDIVVLSPLARGALVQHVTRAPWVDRLQPLSSLTRGNIGCGTVYAFKGLEAPVIILTDIGRDHPGYLSLFYTGASRSLERLIVLSPVSSAV